MKVQILVSLFIGILLSACATEKCTDVNQDRIQQSLNASYDADANSTSATGTLYFGTTTLEASGTCQIEHDSISLSKISLFGTSYTGTKSGLTSSHTFTFTDSAGTEYENTKSIPTAISISSAPSSISKASGVTLNWSGAIGSDETVTIYLNHKSPDTDSATDDSYTSTTTTAGATSANISSSAISNLRTGEYEMYIKREKSVDLDEKTSAGGSFTTSYQSVDYDVTVTD